MDRLVDVLMRALCAGVAVAVVLVAIVFAAWQVDEDAGDIEQ